MSLVALTCAVLLCTTTANADRSYALFVPRSAPAQPAPTVDGVCDSIEYNGSWRFTRILFAPRISGVPPATLHMIATDADLYVCLEGVPFKFTDPDTFVSIVFDTDHDGGSRPDNDLL
jgi:hypothetical protein